MGTAVSKCATLLLIIVLAVSGLIMVSFAFAQSVTKPSIPEFTAEYVDYSYDIAPTYTTDPYTNNTVVQTYGEMMGFGLVSFMTAALFLHRQRDIKRLFSYSSIEHMGIMTFAFGILNVYFRH